MEAETVDFEGIERLTLFQKLEGYRLSKPHLTVNNLSNIDVGLDIRGLRKVYRSRLAFVDFSSFVTRGEVVSLLGPNGAGKSTWLSILLREIHKSDGGSIKTRWE